MQYSSLLEQSQMSNHCSWKFLSNHSELSQNRHYSTRNNLVRNLLITETIRITAGIFHYRREHAAGYIALQSLPAHNKLNPTEFHLIEFEKSTLPHKSHLTRNSGSPDPTSRAKSKVARYHYSWCMFGSCLGYWGRNSSNIYHTILCYNTLNLEIAFK